MDKVVALVSVCLYFAFSSLNVSAFEPRGRDLRRISDLLPTTYFIADEAKISCRGRYGKNYYYGHERRNIRSPKGKVIAKVCARFYRFLRMEGTGILKDRGQGRKTVNYYSKGRYTVMKKCKFGMGTRTCLLPFHTLAANLKIHRHGTIIYIPRADGIELPDGSIHNGIFAVRDTGGAFLKASARRVDMFIGNQRDQKNVFTDAGFRTRKREKAYRVTGESRKKAIEFLKKKFPNLY